jgi:hypothetical protein
MGPASVRGFFMRHTICIQAAMADATFSVIQKDAGWFWCSLTLMSENELIGPFPSQEEAEKDARATLGMGKANDDYDLCT